MRDTHLDTTVRVSLAALVALSVSAAAAVLAVLADHPTLLERIAVAVLVPAVPLAYSGWMQLLARSRRRPVLYQLHRI